MADRSSGAESMLAVEPAYPGPQRRRSASWLGWLARPVASRSWDRLLYGIGGAAGLSLLAYVLFPPAGEAVAFVSFMFWASGPVGTFLPAAAEPTLMALGKLHPPLLLAGLGSIGVALAEWVNYRLFGVILHAPRLTSVREARLMRRAVRWFGVQPFWTVVLCAFTPIPFWMARTCAVVVHYPLARFALATVIGRFPRMYLWALLGSAVPFSVPQIAITGAIVVVLLAAVAAQRGRRLSRAGMAP